MPVSVFAIPFRLFTILAGALALGGLIASTAHAQSLQTVTGTVLEASGRPLDLATVRLVDGTRTVSSTTTTALGQFTLPRPTTACPACALEASRTGFITARAAVPASGAATLTLSITPRRETVVVTATRADAPPAVGGSATSVISADDIARRGSPLLADLLRATPGIVVTPSGGLGTVTSVFVRGGESDYNKVLLDGVPLNEPGGAFNFSNVSTQGIDRVEIVRGAMSALFGSDAMSSVIQIFSARGLRGAPPRVSAFVEGGGYGTRTVDASVAGSAGRWDYAVSGGRFDTDNRVENNAFGNATVAVSAGGALDRAERLTLRTVFRTERQRVGVPGQTAFGRPDLDAFFERADVVAGATLSHRASARWQQQAAFSIADSRQVSTNLLADAPYTPRFGTRAAPFTFFDFTLDTHNVLRRVTASYQGDWRVIERGSLAHVVTIAADSDTERATFEDRLAKDTLDAGRDNVGVTAQHQLLGPRIATAASLRVEHNSSFGSAVVPRGSIGVVVREGTGAVGATTIRASAGRGVKEPSMLESFSRNFYFLGNPDLRPERSRTIDAGVEQDVFEGRGSVAATWFDSRYRDQVSTRVLDFTTFSGQFFNVGTTTSRGVELSGSARPVAALEVAAGYTLLASRIVESTSPDSPIFAVGAWTFRRPRHTGFLRASYTTGALDVNVSGLFAGRQVDSDFSALEPAITEANLPAVWSLSARYRLNRRMELVLRLENLTDEDYMNPVGYEAWRRTAHAGLRVRF